MGTPDERNTIVDEHDNVIGSKLRREITTQDIYRVSALWLTNPRGDILLAQRALTKSHDPGKWGPAVAGTVEEGETYEANITKEVGEELGLSGLDLKPESKLRFQDSGGWQYFTQVFSAVIDKPAEEFTVSKEEVARVRWFGRQELERELKEHPEDYLPSIHRLLTSL